MMGTAKCSAASVCLVYKLLFFDSESIAGEVIGDKYYDATMGPHKYLYTPTLNNVSITLPGPLRDVRYTFTSLLLNN